MKTPRFMILLVAVVAVSCATSGKKINHDGLSQVQPGYTTKAQVIELMGKPQTVQNNADGSSALLYQYAKASNKARNFVPVVGMLTYSLDTQVEMVKVSIGSDGIVTGVDSSFTDDDLNAGWLNTP